ncbi:hypothetical protein ACRVX5_07535 [Clostridioides difficile]|uniref:hypothetical protein n=1 Tax=Clostridioides difficile TaxID=1496 RepID=UPI001F39B91F|nr:hypothetical protein [Clostridioides difficile]
MIKFEVGKTYATRSICDHDCIYTIQVIKRTDKTITYKEEDTVRRAKIRFNNVCEYIRIGNYSMAPNFSAENIVLEDKENVSTTEKYFVISRYYDTDKTIAFIETTSTKYKTEYIRNFDQYVDEFSTLEEAEECLQECLSA